MKRILESAIAVSLRVPPFREARAGRLLVLAYHNVVPPGESPSGERAAQIPWLRFLSHLDVLERYATVVPLNEQALLEASAGRNPRVAVTFDDAYAGAMQWALPEMLRRGLPATVFVAPAFVDGGVFWWDAIAESRGGQLDHPLRSHLLTHCRGEVDRIRAWSIENGVRWVEPAEWARGARFNDFLRLKKSPGVMFGAHTWSHPNLAFLSEAEVRLESVRSIKWLVDRGLPSLSALAYPYGSYSPATEDVLRNLGVNMRLRVEGGFCPTHVDLSQAVPRYNVPSKLSAAGLELRLRGIRA